MILSHSKVSKYLTCAKMYNLHYNLKIRSKYLSSNLWFGSALDDTINIMLLKKKNSDNLTEDEATLLDNYGNCYKSFFLKEITKRTHNRSELVLRDSLLCEYSKADLDLNVLTDETKDKLKQDTGYDNLEEIVDYVYLEKRKGNTVEDDALLTYNKIAWECIYSKGLMILETYEQEILPQIEEVFTVQEKVTLPNEEGDEITGYIDFTCKFIGDDNIYVVDNKSSSKPYKSSDLVESDQLHLYADYKELDHIAYIVYEKNIRKRDPKVRINILKDSVNEDHFEKVFDKFEKVRYSVKEGLFSPTKDKSTCKMQYGKPCIYYDFCHYDRMSDNLIKVGSK